jgi:hypothetical protein
MNTSDELSIPHSDHCCGPCWPSLAPRLRANFGSLCADEAPARGLDCGALAAQVPSGIAVGGRGLPPVPTTANPVGAWAADSSQSGPHLALFHIEKAEFSTTWASSDHGLVMCVAGPRTIFIEW